METLITVLSELESMLPHIERKKEAVSQAAVGWHVQHSLLILNQVTNALKTSNPAAYKPRFSFAKTFVYIFKKIPRVRIKAPASVQPQGVISIDTLQHHFDKAKENLAVLNNLPKNAYFDHPYFGNVNVKASKKFLVIHTRHHLNIMIDILK